MAGDYPIRSDERLVYVPRGELVYLPKTLFPPYYGTATGFGTVCIENSGRSEYYNLFKEDQGSWWFTSKDAWWK